MIATTPALKFKILVLNGCLDRETGAGAGEEEEGFGAVDFVGAIVGACEESRGLASDGSGGAKSGKSEMQEWRKYVTHVVYLSGEGTPRVDVAALREVGIETVRIYGRKVEGGMGMVYDGNALGQALEAILGRRGGGGRGKKSRRNTLEG